MPELEYVELYKQAKGYEARIRKLEGALEKREAEILRLAGLGEYETRKIRRLEERDKELVAAAREFLKYHDEVPWNSDQRAARKVLAALVVRLGK